ncbi:hemagglutinin repeat-containing protein, partial [Halopseudomonas pertucinogena]|uniref:hemagglutinin repeat-containing protein n=1 Tax=Halopseudomonas pertucinogena TaxID=86175 RepID=UPI00166BD59A
MQAGGDAQLSAGNDLIISAVEERSDLMRQDRRHFIERGSVTQHGSEITVGGSLQASADNDLAIIASQVQAGDDLTLAAGGDVLIASAANEQHDIYRYRRSDKKVTRETSGITQQQSEIQAGGDLTILSGNNLIASSSRLEAGGEAYLVAGDQMALLAAEDLDHSFYEKKSKGSFGRKSFRSDQVTRITQQGTEITTGGDLALISGGDQTYQAATLRSGADLELVSGGAISFEGVKDLHQESHEKSKSSWAWQSAKG